MHATTNVWQHQILPQIQDPSKRHRKKVKDACFHGIPARFRAIAWPNLIGNKLMITDDLFEILVEKFNETCSMSRCSDSTMSDLEWIESQANGEDEGEYAQGTEVSNASDLRSFDQNDINGDKKSENGNTENVEDNIINEPLEDTFAEINISESLVNPKHSKSLHRRYRSVHDQIEVDLSRTFPNLAFFHEEAGPMRGWLQEILGAYSLFRPNVSYVQGMSHIAAFLLLFMDREPSFRCFCNILHYHRIFRLVRDLEYESLNRFWLVVDKLLEEQVPSVHAHFKVIGIKPEMFLLEWMLTLLTKPLSLDVAARVWDAYIFYDNARDREIFLLQAILGMLKLLRDQLLVLDFDEALLLLQNLPPTLDVEKYFVCISSLRISPSRYTTLLSNFGIVFDKI